MKRFQPFLTLAGVLVCAGGVAAADLAKVDRTIKKEPSYLGKPKYCLLVFGPEAKTKVWLVIDGDTLYVDRNGNGDLTEKDERVDLPKLDTDPASRSLFLGQRQCKAGNIQDGTLLHTDLEIAQVRLDLAYKTKDREEEKFKNLARSAPDGVLYGVSVAVETRSGRGRLNFVAVADMQGFLGFSDRPANAPVIHFDGPLQMGLQPMQELVRGDQASELHCWVGTPGLGRGTFASLVYAKKPGFIPEDSHPVAEIEFSGNKAVRVVLDKRC